MPSFDISAVTLEARFEKIRAFLEEQGLGPFSHIPRHTSISGARPDTSHIFPDGQTTIGWWTRLL